MNGSKGVRREDKEEGREGGSEEAMRLALKWALPCLPSSLRPLNGFMFQDPNLFLS